jgi:chromatin structure-remodeling complex subunit RSC4
LIAKTTIATHPDIKVPQHYSFDILPSPILSQHSISLNLPPSHYYLRVTPKIGNVAAGRQSKLVVTVNENPIKPKNEEDPKSPIFDTRILPGINTINIEMIAGPPRGAPKYSNPGQDLELEKITVFVNLMRR